jgi:hypothetical protein
MAREDLHFRLRLPEDLKARIENAAQMNDQSMTAEIVERLRWTFGPADEQMLELVAKNTQTEEERQALANRLDLAMAELAETRKQLIDEANSKEDLLARASKAEARLEAHKDALDEMRAENYALQTFIRRSDNGPGTAGETLSAQPITAAIFDEIFGGSRLAKQVEKMREDLAKTIEEVQRRRLSEEEKEDIWQWLQNKDQPDKSE